MADETGRQTMADGLNKVMLLGHLGNDAELRYAQSGTAVLNIRLVVSESYLDRNKVRQERTEWVTCTLFGKRAEALVKYLTKGSQVFVEGGLRTSSYEDKDGNKRSRTEVQVSNIILCGGRSGGSGKQESQGDAPPDDIGDEATPF